MANEFKVFTVKFDMQNSAFEDNPEAETIRVLRAIADRIESDGKLSGFYETIRDINGNDIGRFAAK